MPSKPLELIEIVLDKRDFLDLEDLRARFDEIYCADRARYRVRFAGGYLPQIEAVFDHIIRVRGLRPVEFEYVLEIDDSNETL